MNFILKLMKAFFGLVGLLIGSLVLSSCGPGSRKGYRIEHGEVVHYSGWPAARSIIGAADAESFIDINDNYGKDTRHVFYIGKIIPNADPATFEYLSGAYSRDKNNGYSRDELISTDGPHVNVIPNLNDTPTNVTAEGAPYVRDRYKVYKDTFVIEGADPASFVFVPMFNGYYLTHDNGRVYFQDKPMEGIDGSTFRKVSDFNFCDKQRAWGLVLDRDSYWAPIAGVDIPTFSGIGQYYAKDKQRVYFSNYAVKDADPDTFVETAYLQAKDKNRIYSSGYGSGRP